MPFNPTAARPVAEAIESLDRREPMATALDTRGLSDLPLSVRRRAFFSAKVENARLLELMKRSLQKNVNQFGINRDRASFVKAMQDAAADLGVTPPETGEGTLMDITSTRRLRLIFDIQTGLAKGEAAYRLGMDPAMLNAAPAQELIRVEDREVPRDWPARWEAAGGKFYGEPVTRNALPPGWTESRLVETLKDVLDGKIPAPDEIDPLADVLAYGVEDGQLLSLSPDEIGIKYPGDLANPEALFERDGMEWVRSVDFSEPVELSVNQDGAIELEDGHHRWFAARKLGRKLTGRVTRFFGNPWKKIIDDGVADLVTDEPSRGGRMIALKTDPIWMRISAFGLPWPPFDFNSGMGVRNVRRREAVNLGLLGKRERIEPVDVDLLNLGPSASYKQLPEAAVETIADDFGDLVTTDPLAEVFTLEETALSEFAERVVTGDLPEESTFDLGRPESLGGARLEMTGKTIKRLLGMEDNGIQEPRDFDNLPSILWMPDETRPIPFEGLRMTLFDSFLRESLWRLLVEQVNNDLFSVLAFGKFDPLRAGTIILRSIRDVLVDRYGHTAAGQLLATTALLDF